MATIFGAENRFLGTLVVRKIPIFDSRLEHVLFRVEVECRKARDEMLRYSSFIFVCNESLAAKASPSTCPLFGATENTKPDVA